MTCKYFVDLQGPQNTYSNALCLYVLNNAVTLLEADVKKCIIK